jgi:hypothetical protein
MELRKLIALAINEQPGTVQRNYGPTADAILAALDAAGLVVVPRLPTVDMCEAGMDHMPGSDPTECMVEAGIVFEVMIAASPFAKKEVG